MMHTDKELYKINGQKLYTADYITANNVPKATREDSTGWSKCYGMGTDKGTKNIYTAKGKKVIYTYGEHTWFDTAEERDAHREAMNQERAETNKRNKMLAAIMEHYKSMSNEELANVVATLN